MWEVGIQATNLARFRLIKTSLKKAEKWQGDNDYVPSSFAGATAKPANPFPRAEMHQLGIKTDIRQSLYLNQKSVWPEAPRHQPNLLMLRMPPANKRHQPNLLMSNKPPRSLPLSNRQHLALARHQYNRYDCNWRCSTKEATSTVSRSCTH